MYPNLKLQIFKRGVRQSYIAKLMGISDASLSKIIHGYREPSSAERKLLAGYLEADEVWLFERFEGQSVPSLATSPKLNNASTPSKTFPDAD